MRTCTKCLQEFPLTAEHFQPHAKYAGGFLTGKQQRVLAALADHDFDDRKAAKSLAMEPKEVRRYMECIQRRAAPFRDAFLAGDL